MKVTKELILQWMELEEDEFNIEAFRRKHDIDPESSTLKVTFSRLVEEGQLKRLRRGWVRKVEQIQPIRWWNGEEGKRISIVWPYGVEDSSSFMFDDTIEVFPGDAIVIAGRSNAGKTAFALNFLVNNLHLFESAVMMVNEYKPVRFRDRMKKINWIDYWNENKPKFDLIPVTQNHQDYIKPNALNIIDWILLRGNFWEIAGIIEDMQMPLRLGLLLAVLQKTGGKEYGTGDEWGTFNPCVYLTIDYPYRLNVLKVKSAPLGQIKPEGKMFAFDIIDRGSKFHNIRPVKRCYTCKGRGYATYGKCERCSGKGYIDE